MNIIPSLPKSWRIRLARSAEGDGVKTLIAVFTGLFTGLAAVALIKLIHIFQEASFGHSPSYTRTFFVPIIGGICIAIILKVFPTSRGAGVPEAISGIHRLTHIPLLTIPSKVVASSLSLGTGASGGQEGPMVLIGTTIGQTIGQITSLDSDDMRTIGAAGAAAGIAAAFNAPIGGMLFAMEIIIGQFAIRSLQTVVIASVTGSLVSRHFLGSPQHFIVHNAVQTVSAWSLLGYGIVAIAATFVARTLIQTRFNSIKFLHLEKLPSFFRPIVAGLFMGLFALGIPEVVGTGDHLPALPTLLTNIGTYPVRTFIAGGPSAGWLTVGLMAVLVISKVMATGICINMGHPIGTLAPSMFIGAALGNGIGHAFNAMDIPGVSVEPSSFAIAGMAALLGASMKAPLTSILLVYELTGSYDLILPLMFTSGISTFLAIRFWDFSLYTLPLKDHGSREAKADQDIMQTILVHEVMQKKFESVPLNMPILELHEKFLSTGHHGFPVLDSHGNLAGVVSQSDLTNKGPSFSEMGSSKLRVKDLYSPNPKVVREDDFVYRAIRTMSIHGYGRLPVVASDDPLKVKGIIGRRDVIEGYKRVITRTMSRQRKARFSKMRDLDRTVLQEAIVHKHSVAAHRRIAQITWPSKSILVSVHRDNEEVIIPRGDTLLLPGDLVSWVRLGEGGLGVMHILTEQETAEDAAICRPRDQWDIKEVTHKPPRARLLDENVKPPNVIRAHKR